MKKITQSSRFRRDFKRMAKRGSNPNKLEAILNLLVSDTPLPERCRPHKLVGNYVGLWECHIEPDWLLVYDLGDDYIDLIRTGTHADLFD
jgi:mRNA interferase YafQ